MHAGAGSGRADPAAVQVTELSLAYVEDYFGRERAHALLATVGLVAPDDALPDRIRKVDFWQVCVDSILASGDEAHGSTRRPVPKSTFGAIYSAVNQMDTVGDGFRRLAELMPLSPAEITVAVGHGRDLVHLHFAYASGVEVTPRLERYLESCILVFHCVLLWIAARPVVPVHVRLAGVLDAGDGSLLAGIGAASSRQGNGVTLSYTRADMDVPLGARKYQVWAAHETSTFLAWIAEAGRPVATASSEDVDRLRALLSRRSLDQDEAARVLAVSPATLRRRLARAGTTFRDVSRDVRRERLIALLGTNESLDDVAAQLGFSDRRSLWRTCKEWLGMSPSEWRHRKAAARRAEGVSGSVTH